MTRNEAQQIAQGVRDHLPMAMRQRLKSIHIMPKLHNGFLTIRVHCVPVTAEDPEPYIFVVEEI